MIRKDKDFTKVDTHTYTQESKEEREKKYSGIGEDMQKNKL